MSLTLKKDNPSYIALNNIKTKSDKVTTFIYNIVTYYEKYVIKKFKSKNRPKPKISSQNIGSSVIT